MAAVDASLLFYVILSVLHQGLGLMSDYKVCGDPECASMMSRVQAQRDHISQDCRFLNFKKGDMITVYYKLLGKRSGLWAGSMDKLFGLFPKNAVKVDQRFVNEKMEIQVPTQEYDFFCIDENGLVIESNTEFDDLEDDDLTQETQETDIKEADDKLINKEDNDPGKTSVEYVSGQNGPKTTEKGGSSWIGSAVSGWFGRNKQSNDEQQDEKNDLVLDIGEDHTEENTNSGALGWIRGELTNAFGIEQKDSKAETQDSIEKPAKDSQQSSSWLSMGIDVLGLSKDNDPIASKTEVESADKDTYMEDQSILNNDQSLDLVEDLDHIVHNEDHSLEDTRSEDGQTEERGQTGWYGSIYNGISDLYSKEESKNDEDDEGKDNVSKEEDSPGSSPNTDDSGKKESESNLQPIISVSGLTSVFDNLNFPFQSDKVKEDMESDEKKTAREGDPGIDQDECVHEACLHLYTNTLITSQEAENNQITEEKSDMNDLKNTRNESDSEEQEQLENIIKQGQEVEDVQTTDQETIKYDVWGASEIKKTTSHLNNGLVPEENDESEEAQTDEGAFYQLAAFVGEVTINEFISIMDKVVSALPDDIRPGPDLYGLPWEAVVFTVFLGLFTLLLFSCRFIQSIKSRLYASKEKRMAQKVAELLDEKCKVLETISEVKQKYEKLEFTLQNSGMSARAVEKDSLEESSQKLEQSNTQMKKEIERLQEELSHQNKARKQQEDQLAELEQTLRNLEEEAKERKSQLEQDNTTLKIHEINTERLQKNLQAAKEEHTMLLESKEQLVQEAEGWGERLSELEEEMKMCERSHAGMLEDCANKDERINSLTDCLLKMRDLDSEDEKSVDCSNNTSGTENGDRSDFHQKQKIQKLIEAAKMSADLKSMEEDKNRVFAKLTDEIKAKEDLQAGIQQLEEKKEMFESESARFSSESQKLQQKLQIMTEMYQENELKLHRMLTVEEKERLQKEEKLDKAGKKISLAAEELNTYRQRGKDLEEELERTSHAYKNQITSHEKKAHDNWLAARAADRDLADVKRENASIRQRLTDAQFRLEMLEKDPYAREDRPLFRGERSPYGPSPLGRPASETRAFLSPPTLMDGPLRLSPQFVMGPGGRASRGVVERSSGRPDFEQSGAHSDSGSLSPSWDRDHRGPPGPTGHPLIDPGMPYRRPPPGPYPMGPLPPRPPLRPEPYFGDRSDSSFLRNSSAVSENDNREGPHSLPGDMRMPTDQDSRMGPPQGPLLMGMPPLMDPRDPRFSHRGPYGPPEFFPPRGPGGPSIGMRGLLPPGMFPRGPLPLPQQMGYLPQRPPSDSFPPAPPPRPSPPGSEQPPGQSPSPHDVI